MRANYLADGRPKEIEDLSSTAMKRIEEYYTERLRDEIDEYMEVDQELLLKYSMIILANPPFSFDRDMMLTYLGNWKSVKRQTRNRTKYDEQTKFLDEKLKKFDLPENFIRSLCHDNK